MYTQKLTPIWGNSDPGQWFISHKLERLKEPIFASDLGINAYLNLQDDVISPESTYEDIVNFLAGAELEILVEDYKNKVGVEDTRIDILSKITIFNEHIFTKIDPVRRKELLEEKKELSDYLSIGLGSIRPFFFSFYGVDREETSDTKKSFKEGIAMLDRIIDSFKAFREINIHCISHANSIQQQLGNYHPNLKEEDLARIIYTKFNSDIFPRVDQFIDQLEEIKIHSGLAMGAMLRNVVGRESRVR